MNEISILWVDDEIDLLKPHIMFLEEKGYHVDTADNGNDALDMVATGDYAMIFLDEHMPGMNGLETLAGIKEISTGMPVIMITRSEEEELMDEAIGSKIADYLIKPVNPKQILLTIKKHVDTRRLVTRKTTEAYRAAFSGIGNLIAGAGDIRDWEEIYRKIVFWELELENSGDAGMSEILVMQKAEANREFARFVEKRYSDWIAGDAGDIPCISVNLLKDKVFPLIESGEKVVLLLLDNLRFDQWRTLFPVIREHFHLESEELYCSILPTTTQYARNALFAGLMPEDIQKLYPGLWVDEDEDEGKNLMEKELLTKQLNRFRKSWKVKYEKSNNQKSGKKIADNVQDLLVNDFVVLVYNFVDMMAHARTEMDMIRELAFDEPAYRSLTLSWFSHSPVLDLIRNLSGQPVKLIITTDHGSIRVDNPIRVVGDRKTSTNLRYKQGRSLNYNREEVFSVKDPGSIHLPAANLSSSFIFARMNDYMVYPRNYHHYVNLYRNTFQHGGISMEEMMIPFVVLSSST